MDQDIGGRLFFTNARRSLVDEDEINLTSVGIDIGSSTSHLVFSRVTLERIDARYVVAARKLLFESEILLTPYTQGDSIDTEALSAFLKTQYRRSGLGVGDVDTGALILTGTALRRRNARAIGELFSAAAGKFVSVSAGDEMEAVLAAFGSGAVAKSGDREVLNVDVGGGTTKIARCSGGAIEELTAIDVGARLLALDGEGRLIRLEAAGERFAQACGIRLALGEAPDSGALDHIAARMADCLMEAMGARPLSELTRSLLRLDGLKNGSAPAMVAFSGGVSEYIYGRAAQSFGDLGPALAEQIAQRVKAWGAREIYEPARGIRATVIGASQYTIQVSGSTIFVSQEAVLPLRNIASIKPKLAMETPDIEAIAGAVRAAHARLGPSIAPVALCYNWTQSASFGRIDAFCRGIIAGFAHQIAAGHPLILIGDGDIGGLIGIHLAQEMAVKVPIVSIDGISLQEFDFVDIGAMLEGSGAVPVVVKSLIFPAAEAADDKHNVKSKVF